MSYLSESINMDSLMRECLECGQLFIPDESGEECCSRDCAATYYRWNDWGGNWGYNTDEDDYGDDYGDDYWDILED